MYPIQAKPAAAAAIAKAPGLSEQIGETLDGIIETALEIRRLRASLLELDGVYLRVRVGRHVISYTLDLDAPAATVVMVEQIDRKDAGKATAA